MNFYNLKIKNCWNLIKKLGKPIKTKMYQFIFSQIGTYNFIFVCLTIIRFQVVPVFASHF